MNARLVALMILTLIRSEGQPRLDRLISELVNRITLAPGAADQALAKINDLQAQRQAILGQVAPKDMFESTAEYQQRMAPTANKIEPLDRAIEDLKRSFYADPTVLAEFDAYDADKQELSVSVKFDTYDGDGEGLAIVRQFVFSVPRATAKAMHEEWSSVGLAFNHPELLNKAERTPALLWGDKTFVQLPPVPQSDEMSESGGGVTLPPVRTYFQEPEYTKEARKAKIQGEVWLSVVVDEKGIPKVVGIIRSLDPGLDKNAIEAVSKWRFQPGLKDGKPVPVRATVAVSFYGTF